ncbi:CHC2 zinc finger domain-containing protein [Roseateles violae]|uniref:CHC2 zinc finger domain-containing protein n=1 Tax=Roseateles violae TaxID=3058042 RepID=A0ABT8DVJ4_9BURK|nr:CHC2 zinc finger domain-containing protein [Pelomonas sp. PFR6]MDN3920402.1 CHC2 zinc finger domain-containing protein [Pelomonas sp. PFR6]
MGKRFDRSVLPDPADFYGNEGLALIGPGLWKTTRCVFHGGSDSMRISMENGAYRCMACGQSGGDVLNYYMEVHGAEFMEAAEALAATLDDGKPQQPRRKTTLTATAALAQIQAEAWFVACTALATADAIKEPAARARLIEASRTIQNVMQEFAE